MKLADGPGYTSRTLPREPRSPVRRWAVALDPGRQSDPGAGGGLAGIAASPPANAWAVGQFGAVGGDDAFAVRYCASTRASG